MFSFLQKGFFYAVYFLFWRAKMIRATTPTHTFVLPFDYATNVVKLLITYKQGDAIVVEKEEKDVSINSNKITTILTQEETKLFNVNETVRIQVKILTKEGGVMASNVFTVAVSEILNDEVM
jgi:hypothetical protein